MFAYGCTCNSGWAGALCDIGQHLKSYARDLNVESLLSCSDMNKCASSPCQNGATCQNLPNDYSCTCKPGYKGNQCETGAISFWEIYD